MFLLVVTTDLIGKSCDFFCGRNIVVRQIGKLNLKHEFKEVLCILKKDISLKKIQIKIDVDLRLLI